MRRAKEWRKKKLTYPIQPSHHLTKRKNKQKGKIVMWLEAHITNIWNTLKYTNLKGQFNKTCFTFVCCFYESQWDPVWFDLQKVFFFTKESESYRFGTTWGWQIDHGFQFRVNYPFKCQTNVKLYVCFLWKVFSMLLSGKPLLTS